MSNPVKGLVQIESPLSHIDDAGQRAADYLYKIDGNPTPEQGVAIGQLRQLINEVFVANGRQISSQVIYDMLREVFMTAQSEGGS